VPRFWFTACGLKDASHGDDLIGLGVLCLRTHVTSHFYGAKRTVGYVPFDSESLVTGKLFEDIREAVTILLILINTTLLS
jgi:chlorophyllide a reductase subunit Y